LGLIGRVFPHADKPVSQDLRHWLYNILVGELVQSFKEATMLMRWIMPPLMLLLALNVPAQEPAPWHDLSPHTVQFVTVEKDVKLEVLDWGGTGRPIVLLAGLGDTAHLFDDFAPKLTSEYHVYGITRRGFGASSAPAPDPTNYSATRLGDDVLAVMDALKIDRPVLVGHSLGGEELTTVADRHPERVAGLVYLDAGYAYAYYDSSRIGDTLKIEIDWNELRTKGALAMAGDGAREKQDIADLLNTDLPAFEEDLQQVDNVEANEPPPQPQPTPADYENFDRYREFWKRTVGVDIPDGELQQDIQPTSDGRVEPRKSNGLQPAIMAGMEKYTEIKAPVLAIFAGPHDVGPYAQNDPALEKFNAYDADYMKRVADGFQKGVPSARVLLLPHASHLVFLSNEADVLREMRTFLAGLK
jgi:non-heme chloroperoxidase